MPHSIGLIGVPRKCRDIIVSQGATQTTTLTPIVYAKLFIGGGVIGLNDIPWKDGLACFMGPSTELKRLRHAAACPAT